MASGVKLDPECIEAFNSFKLGKKEAFIIYGFNENATKIVVLHKEAKRAADDSLRSKSRSLFSFYTITITILIILIIKIILL